jgi:heme/copper-type cytochrome/quinol oxidase subunit 2
MLSEEEVLEYNKTEEGKVTPKYRLLSVDNALNLPVEKVLRTLVTSTDVLHS